MTGFRRCSSTRFHNLPVSIELQGADDLIAELRSLPDKMRRQILRTNLAAGGRLVRDAAKARAPVLQGRDRRRRAGTVRDAIKVRTSKRDRKAGDVGVFVNVKPAAGASKDPYYWRWIEFGRSAGMTRRKISGSGKQRKTIPVRVGAIPAAGFLAGAADQFPAALARIEAGFVRSVAKLNQRRPDAK